MKKINNDKTCIVSDYILNEAKKSALSKIRFPKSLGVSFRLCLKDGKISIAKKK
ncbi:hypothetical protein OMAG_002325 [Candidatus Omnitrophus magneticus]|uniref:Uncharacterized protein n=1 Tax=Candidatus Omnitrophus magneticus TaxID=1609969 RepID=A0A0F0CQM0_9BACT|nr:hypothetical protein OMAG_002325 [Candidatus Omnitrophus magneticus]